MNSCKRSKCVNHCSREPGRVLDKQGVFNYPFKPVKVPDKRGVLKNMSSAIDQSSELTISIKQADFVKDLKKIYKIIQTGTTQSSYQTKHIQLHLIKWKTITKEWEPYIVHA